MAVPADYRYTKDHEWAKRDGASFITGITDYAQSQLGDVVFLELPEVGSTVKKGDSMAVVESVKAASDIYAPVSGKVLGINEGAVAAPEIINSDPYSAGWLVKIEPTNATEYEALLDAENYERLLKELGD